jgi:hypothetical protein
MHLPLLSICNDKTNGKGKSENTDLDDEAWRVATRENSPQAYWQYLNHPWTRHAVQAQKRLGELSEAEWEREVKNGDSEEVIEGFINKYKDGPYVTLAKETLKVAKAWATINKATDPHVLFGFPSYYHDPVFEKLAKDALNKLDDQAWQSATIAATRETITKYLSVWSRLHGLHLQEAQNRLSELDDDDAWRIASREDNPKAYRQYLNHPWTRHAAEAQKYLDEFDNQAWRSAANALTREAVLQI